MTQKIWRISALCTVKTLRAKNPSIFFGHFLEIDDFINSFWLNQTFSCLKFSYSSTTEKNSKCLGLFSNGVGVGRREGCMIEWCISSIFLAPKTFMVRMTIFKPLLLLMGRSKVYYIFETFPEGFKILLFVSFYKLLY